MLISLVAHNVLFRKKDTERDSCLLMCFVAALIKILVYSCVLLLFVLNSVKFCMQAVYLLSSERSSPAGLVLISQIHLLVLLHPLGSLS
jgi:hypothetical protein